MEYSLSQITTREDCDVLLDAAIAEKRNLEIKNLQLDKQYAEVTTGSAGIDATLLATSSELTALESVVATLPEGETKETMQTRIMSLTLKKRQLTTRRENYGIIALLQKEYAMTCIDKEIIENDAYREALERRKSEF